MSDFFGKIDARIKQYEYDDLLIEQARSFQNLMIEKDYVYNFSWFNLPIIQIPQDLYLLQEICWKVQPNLIIETGIAHGGSLIHSASLLSLLQVCGVIKDPLVIGVDIDIKKQNREAIQTHPLGKIIRLFEGSSIDPEIVANIKELCDPSRRVLVILDSNHEYNHVYQELLAYSPLVSTDSYCLVADTGIEFTPPHLIGNRPWGPGNSPYRAVNEFLNLNHEFILDKDFQSKVWITAYLDGILKKIHN